MKTFLQTLFFFLLVTQISFAQWVRTNLTDTLLFVESLVVKDMNLFAGGWGGLFLTTDNGSNWTPVNNGLTATNILSLAISDTNIFAGTAYDGVFLSTNNGTSWTSVNNGLPSAGGNRVRTLAPSGTNIFASVWISFMNGWNPIGVHLTTDNGTNWTSMNNGLTNIYVSSFASSGMNIFAGTEDGVFLTTDNGSSWTAVNNGLTNIWVLSLAISDIHLFAGTWGEGIFISTNNGTGWAQVNNGLTNTYVWSLIVFGTNIFAGTEDGVFLTTDNGSNWMTVNDGLTNTRVSSFALLDTFIFAGTDSGVWRRPLSEIVTAVENEATQPTNFQLSQNFPNPFNPSTKIKYSVPQTSQVQIKVFDILGNEIEALVNEEKSAGSYELSWNAANLPSGVYFYQIQAGEFIQTKKMILLK